MVTVSPELKLRGKAKKGRKPPKATNSWPSVFTMNSPPSFKGLLNTKPASLRGEIGSPVRVTVMVMVKASLLLNKNALAPELLEKCQESRLAKPVGLLTFCSSNEMSEG